jgi:alpha-beta hydrolase superfamily lysophospholipase
LIKTDKETGIMYRQWGRPDNKAVLLLVHGLGAHSARWDAMAEFFARNAFSSYALELKGFGETKTTRGHIDSFGTYFNDIRTLRDIIVKENPAKKIYLVGESLGALIAFSVAAAEPSLFDGLVCIAPAFKARMTLPAAEYLKIVLALIVDPKRPFNMPFDPAMCTRDEGARKKMEDDQREHRLATAKLLFETVLAQTKSGRTGGNIHGPVLFLIPGEDKLTDSAAAVKIFRGLKTEDRTLIEYPGMYHSMTIDSGNERVFKDILKWTADRTGAR